MENEIKKENIDNSNLSFTKKIKERWKRESEEIKPIPRFLIIIISIFISTIIASILKEVFNVFLGLSFIIFYILFYRGLIWIWKSAFNPNKNIIKK